MQLNKCSEGVVKYYIIALEGGGGLTENADAADGGSQVTIDNVILEHIFWKIPTNNLIYIQLNSYSDYSSIGGCDHKIKRLNE